MNSVPVILHAEWSKTEVTELTMSTQYWIAVKLKGAVQLKSNAESLSATAFRFITAERGPRVEVSVYIDSSNYSTITLPCMINVQLSDNN